MCLLQKATFDVNKCSIVARETVGSSLRTIVRTLYSPSIDNTIKAGNATGRGQYGTSPAEC
jgi:hypothetical protein